MSERYFDPDEVEALIPTLTDVMERLMAAHRALEEVRQLIREEQHRIAMVGGGVIDAGHWQELRSQAESQTAVIEGGLREIQALGGVPKDLEQGLVDFAHKRSGRVVNLCWKYPEREIRFWHGLDEGYVGRKPL